MRHYTRIAKYPLFGDRPGIFVSRNIKSNSNGGLHVFFHFPPGANLFASSFYPPPPPIRKILFFVPLVFMVAGCATLTEDANTPIALSLSDGANGKCTLSNKRGSWEATVPVTVSVRKSDDVLQYNCETEDGRTVSGAIPSTIGGKIVASAIFLDFGIVDAITDKHRKYPASFVIPIQK